MSVQEAESSFEADNNGNQNDYSGVQSKPTLRLWPELRTYRPGRTIENIVLDDASKGDPR